MKNVFPLLLASFLAACASTSTPLIYNPNTVPESQLTLIQTPAGASLDRKNIFRVNIFSVFDTKISQYAIQPRTFMENERHKVKVNPGNYLFDIACDNTDLVYRVSTHVEIEENQEYIVYCEPKIKKGTFLGLANIIGMEAFVVPRDKYLGSNF